MARVGIIGRGWGARVQEPAFREAGLEVARVAARSEWQDVVKADDIDLITVVLPPAMHREIAIAALEHGKHVLSEKPIFFASVVILPISFTILLALSGCSITRGEYCRSTSTTSAPAA